MYVKRTVVPVIQDLIGKFPCLSVTGPRQSGKSLLLKNEFSNYAYYNLEDPHVRQMVESDPKGFLAQNGDKIIIDEAQHVASLFSYVQLEVDNNPEKKIILSGSQAFLLHDKVSQSLAGRIAITHLLPFSVEELASAKFNTSDLSELIYTGFYPRIYDRNIPAEQFYPSYQQTYVERDIRTLRNVGDLSLFEAFVRLCAGRIGQIINYTSIANDIGVSLNTVKTWISLLKTSFIAFEVKPYYRNFNKRTVKTGKLYFYDTGLACSLLGMTHSSQYNQHYLKGGLFENYILLEIMKHFYNQVKVPKIYFWQDSNGKEVDCIVEVDGKTYALELKSAATWHKDFSKNVIKWNTMGGFDPNNSAVIYAGQDEIKMNGIQYLGWTNFLKHFG